MNDRERVVELPPVVVGQLVVRLWYLVLEPRTGDATAAVLSSDDRRRLRAMSAPHAARLLARRALTAQTVADHMGCAPTALVWRSDRTARSVVDPSGQELHMSLSSSGARGLLALAPVPVGVDVELEADVPEWDDVAALMLSPDERRWITGASGLGGDAAGDRFLRTWVRKEAVVKCTRAGLVGCDLQAFSVVAQCPVAVVRGDNGSGRPVITAEVPLENAFAAVAVAEPADLTADARRNRLLRERWAAPEPAGPPCGRATGTV